MTLEQNILQILQQAQMEIRANMAANNENASGRTSASLTAEPYREGLRLLFKAGNVAPMDTLEVGRPAGKVPYNMTDIIYQWSVDKGLAWGDEKARRKIAAAVGWGKIAGKSKKLQRIGTDRHYAHVDIWRTPQQKALREIRDAVRVVVGSEIHETISKLS